MYCALSLLMVAAVLAGCHSYVESTPRRLVEGDHSANYVRVFREPIPSEVTVVNSAVVTYSFRPGVVTTDDFEFELLVPRPWIQKTTKRFGLGKGDGEFIQSELRSRREQAHAWYAPKPLDQYKLYRDPTSVGYVHMLVQKEAESDGRLRVFISKH
ncbi:MAG: hypothetical protein L0Y58_26060 [Verrucomicrobia subdivision 3 bacterium]|nr:hypothetical protein [Limisphaerales bacterium]